MKKIIATLICVLMLALTLTACGGSGLSGKYRLTGMESSGVTIKEGDALWDTAVGAMGDCYMDFTGSDAVSMAFAGEEKEGTYTVDGDKITVTIDGDPADGTLKDNKITLEVGGEKMIFEK